MNTSADDRVEFNQHTVGTRPPGVSPDPDGVYHFVLDDAVEGWPVVSDPRVEWIWTPILGPASVMLWRRLAYWATLRPSFSSERSRLAALMGIPPNRVDSAFRRMTDFRIMVPTGPHSLAVKVVAPLPTRGVARRLPEDLAQMLEVERQRREVEVEG